VLSLLLLVAAAPAVAGEQMKDSKQCVGKDHPLFTRMPGFFLYSCAERQFAAQSFAVTDAKQKRTDVRVEGHFYKYYYRYGGAPPPPSGLQCGRNYANAATSSGGEVLYSADSGTTTVRFTRGGKQTWAAVYWGGSGLNIIVVEAEAMKQDVTANVDALKGGLASNGHVELIGIFFDTGKSELKPESQPALVEVGKLLAAQPQLALWVVGHTDSVGTVDSNLTLSQARAASVVKALVEGQRIDPQRLAPYGAGPYAPVATNASDEGRARNRRVELVAR
jgi:outer membrane protein OmpA-like peptidoglycan-associated protein